MEKDFENWHHAKMRINSSYAIKLFHEREIWWCSVGVNVGDEEDGKNENFSRPVLVLKKLNKRIFVGIPLSRQVKENRLYSNFHFKNSLQSAIIGQIKTFDNRRLEERWVGCQRASLTK
jgi:mRNA interferase MazF